jgi:diaminopimelate epimerase
VKKSQFYKYQGTGNDFILIDGREKIPTFSQIEIEQLCHRRFGVGADGLIILVSEPGFDFRMIYYNSDGRESSMCGNGGRCIAQFAHDLGLGSTFNFIAIDGPHKAEVGLEKVGLQMKDPSRPSVQGEGWFLDTGSPHHIEFANNPQEMDLIKAAQDIRYSEHYTKEGVNVNFIKGAGQYWEMRTYERGVEDETFSCGTGVTAAAIVAHHAGKVPQSPVYMSTKGGELSLSFDFSEKIGYSNIWLEGPAVKVFEGNF